jgi:hypothetical protein
MITKRFVLATSMIVFVAMSGQAYAGTTISDNRYWPSEVSSADQNPVQRPENAFGHDDRGSLPRDHLNIFSQCKLRANLFP